MSSREDHGIGVLIPTNLRIEHILDDSWPRMVPNREVSGLTEMIEAELESIEGGIVAKRSLRPPAVGRIDGEFLDGLLGILFLVPPAVRMHEPAPHLCHVNGREIGSHPTIPAADANRPTMVGKTSREPNRISKKVSPARAGGKKTRK